MFDWATGRLLSSVGIAPGVNQIGFDPGNRRIYCAGGSGMISVVEARSDTLMLIGNVTTELGVRTVAVDPVTHSVWAAFGDKKKSHILRFKAM